MAAIDIEAEGQAALEHLFRCMDLFENERQGALEREEREPSEEFVVGLEDLILAAADSWIGEVPANWFLLSLFERMAQGLEQRAVGNLHDAFRLTSWLGAQMAALADARKLIENPPQPRTQYLPTREEAKGLGMSENQLARCFKWFFDEAARRAGSPDRRPPEALPQVRRNDSMKRGRYKQPIRHEPSQAEIREACERIQAGWTAFDLKKHKAPDQPLETPVVSIANILAEKHA